MPPMKMSPVSRNFAAWMACLAILLVALAPSISHALAATSEAQAWTEICTATGIKLVKVTDEQAGKSFFTQKHDEHYEDCPFCRIDNHAFTLPPGPATVRVAEPWVRPPPAFLYQAPPLRLSAWPARRTRAPPLI